MNVLLYRVNNMVKNFFTLIIIALLLSLVNIGLAQVAEEMPFEIDLPEKYQIPGSLDEDKYPLMSLYNTYEPDIRIDPTLLNFRGSKLSEDRTKGPDISILPPRSPSNEHAIRILVDGRPPEVLRESGVVLPELDLAAGINILSNVPAFDWCYGCSPTSAAMMMGYYDNNGYPDMYTGPANGGVCPLDNSGWGYGKCPLSATCQGIDGLTQRGHVDDYWISSGSGGPDPYVANHLLQHTWSDCTADFMGTNQDKFNLNDGGTSFWFNDVGVPLYDYYAGMGQYDGCYGMRRFVESRGYIVQENFNQFIQGYNGYTNGFTFDDYTAEIDAGHPVVIHVSGHSMLGFGYDNSIGQQAIYIHNTWDHYDHLMQWGGSYSGLLHYGVTVMRMAPANCPWQAGVFSIIEDAGNPLTIDSVSTNEPWLILDHPSTSFDMVEYGQQAVIMRINSTRTVSCDSDIVTINSNDPDEDPYPGGVAVNIYMCGDVDCNGIINIQDVRMLMNNVSHAGYTVDPLAGDVDGDRDIDGDDVWLLLKHVFDPDAYLLNCTIC